MHKVRNMLLVVLVLGAAMAYTARPAFAVGSLTSDPVTFGPSKPTVDPVTGEPDVGQTLPHPTTSHTVQSPVGEEGGSSVRTFLRLSIGRIWAALYLRVGI